MSVTLYQGVSYPATIAKISLGSAGVIEIIFNAATVTLDATTLSEYQAAIAAAGSDKRVAGANAVVTAFQPAHRLVILRNAVTVVQADYTGDMTVNNDGSNVSLGFGTLSTVSAITTSDLYSGTWTFEVQGGASYARKISGVVGVVSSSDTVALNDSPAAGMGFVPAISFMLPRSIDGLA